MPTLYGHPNTRSLRVAWTAEELGIHYDYVKVALMEGEHRQPAFMALNPAAKVPLFVDGELVLSESAAICSYLADNHPEAHLIPPPGSAERGQHDRWCYFALTELEQPLWTLAKHSFALPEKYRVEAIKDTARWEFHVAAGVLAKGLGERTYMVGENFTVADILISHCLFWAQSAKLALGHENLETYRERHQARPALARARAREAG